MGNMSELLYIILYFKILIPEAAAYRPALEQLRSGLVYSETDFFPAQRLQYHKNEVS